MSLGDISFTRGHRSRAHLHFTVAAVLFLTNIAFSTANDHVIK